MTDEWKAEEHEDPNVGTRSVLKYVFGFLVFVAVLFGGLNVYYRSFLTSRTVDITLRDFPAPRLQPNPTADYLNFSAEQTKQIGATALPIDKAMATVVARGIQAYDPVAGTPPSGPTLATGATIDGAPRATPSPPVAPYGVPK